MKVDVYNPSPLRVLNIKNTEAKEGPVGKSLPVPSMEQQVYGYVYQTNKQK